MLTKMIRSTRIAPAMLFVAVAIFIFFRDMDNKWLYLAANAVVIVAVVAVVERLRGRPEA